MTVLVNRIYWQNASALFFAAVECENKSIDKTVET